LEVAKRSGSDTVILAEGVFSALACGRNGVCAYGKFVSAPQIELIANAGFKRVVIALDGDVGAKTIYKLAKRMLAKRLETYVVEMPRDKDPADLGRVEMAQRIYAAEPLDSTKILHRLLLRTA
jgi:DNA primase